MTFSVDVTAVNQYGTTSSPSAATAAVSPIAPARVTAPTVSGTAAVGKVLSAGSGQWTSLTAPSYTYQWAACAQTCSVIDGATNATFTVTAAEIGKRLAVVVAAKNSYGLTLGASAQTAVVSAPAATLAHWLDPLLRVSGKAGRLSAIKRAKGYKATFKAAVAGTVKITWTVEARIGHSTRYENVVVGRASRATTTPASAVKVTLTSAGLRLLKTLTHVKVTATAAFTYASGAGTKTTRAIHTLTLTR